MQSEAILGSKGIKKISIRSSSRAGTNGTTAVCKTSGNE